MKSPVSRYVSSQRSPVEASGPTHAGSASLPASSPSDATTTAGEPGARSPLVDTAERLHDTALRAFRLGNRGRLELCRSLRALHTSRQYLALGFPSIVAYSTRFFRFRRSQTYECVRVADALEKLPGCTEAFVAGAIDWSALKQITRVATGATEREWLAFSRKHNNVQLCAEVSDAVQKRRERPRSDRFGLPNVEMQVVLRLSRTEHEVLRKGLERVASEVSERLGGSDVEMKDVLLYLAQWLLETEPAARASQRRPREEPAHSLLLQLCPGCRRGSMHTEDGRVELAAEQIERVEGDARWEVILPEESRPTLRGDSPPGSATGSGEEGGRDRPTPPALRRKVLLRDGGVCTNPHCFHRADHCHHVIFRSQGGRTVLSNEVAVCGMCHSLIHAGLLVVPGTPGEDLRWRARAERLGSVPGSERDADSPPEIRVVARPFPDASRDQVGPSPGRDPGSTRVDPEASEAGKWESLARGLVRLGMRLGEARRRVERAVESLEGELTEERVLRAALVA